MKLLTFDPKKNKKVLIGEIAGDTLFRDVEAKHFMNVLQGYGIQEVGFSDAISKGVKFIVLKEAHTGKRWKSDIDTWKLHGKVADYGHGKQRFLSMKYMHERKDPGTEKEERELQRTLI